MQIFIYVPMLLFYYWPYFTILLLVASSQNEIFSEGYPKVKPDGILRI